MSAHLSFFLHFFLNLFSSSSTTTTDTTTTIPSNVIDLHSNLFCNPIPHQLGLLVRLYVFHVLYNRLESEIPSHDYILAVDVYHSRPSETPNPLVGSLCFTAASVLPDSPTLPQIVHSLDLLRPSGRPQGKLRIKASLLEREIEHCPPASAPAMYYNFVPGGSYHCSPPAPCYYPTCDYYPPLLPPPPSHAFVQSSNQPLPRAPPSPPDYRVAHPLPSPLVRAYGNYHHDGNSIVSFIGAHSQFDVEKTSEVGGSGGVGGDGRRGEEEVEEEVEEEGGGRRRDEVVLVTLKNLTDLVPCRFKRGRGSTEA